MVYQSCLALARAISPLGGGRRPESTVNWVLKFESAEATIAYYAPASQQSAPRASKRGCVADRVGRRDLPVARRTRQARDAHRRRASGEVAV